MKDQRYQKELGSTAAYMIRAGKRTTQYKEVVLILMGDTQFGSVRAVAAVAKKNIEAVDQIKSNHSLYPK